MILRVRPPSHPVRVVMQRAGYVEFRDPRTGDMSFTRRLGTYFYPRWHCYVDTGQETLTLNIHLDQKQPSYAGTTKHSGEYDGPAVEAEGHRLAVFFS